MEENVAGIFIEYTLARVTPRVLLGYLLGVKVRNMKMDLNIYGTWRWVEQ